MRIEQQFAKALERQRRPIPLWEQPVDWIVLMLRYWVYTEDPSRRE